MRSDRLNSFLGRRAGMSDYGKQIRLNRILAQSGRGGLVVAFDHALVLGPIPGTEDPCGQISRFVAARPNAILLNLGLIRRCIDCFPRGGTPGLIARIDWTTVWMAQEDGGVLRSCLVARPEEALRYGADAVLTYLVVGTGDADFEAKEIARNAEVARACERAGIPMIVETVARGKAVENPGDRKWLGLHTRIAAELGADVIKTDYAGSADAMRQVVKGCPLPILVLGGSRHQGALDVVRGAMAAGAAGVFFGRNVFQSDDMEGFLREARNILDGAEAFAGRK
jgi:DhnA family fructose-bisphosphate aldolase class Ia